MRRMFVVATLVLAMAGLSACGGDEEDPAEAPAGPTSATTAAPAPAGGTMTTEEYCDEIALDRVGPLTEAYNLALRELDEAVEAGDEARQAAAIGDLQDTAGVLTDELRDVADELADPEFAAAIARFADATDAFVDELAGLAATGELADAEAGDLLSTEELQAALAEGNTFCGV